MIKRLRKQHVILCGTVYIDMHIVLIRVHPDAAAYRAELGNVGLAAGRTEHTLVTCVIRCRAGVEILIYKVLYTIL